MILLELTDFDQNFQQLAKSAATDPVLQNYIDRYEEIYIKKILGVELGQKFIDDIKGDDSDSASIEARFQILLDGFIKQEGACIYEAKPFKDILASLVFFEYVSTTQARHTQSGVTLNQSEVSTAMSADQACRFAEQKYNNAIPSIKAVQLWCGCEDKDNYTEYAGVYFRPKYSNLL